MDRIERNRQVYEAIKASGVDESQISQSFLRITTLAVNGQSNYDFPLAPDATQHKCDKRLDKNDSFIVTEHGILLMQEEPTAPGTGALQSYPNASYLGADVAGESLLLHMETFYQKSLRYKEGNTVVTPDFPTRLFRQVPQSQQSSATTKSEGNGMNGLAPLVPTHRFDGAAANSIEFECASGPWQFVQHATATKRNYLVYYAIGFLIKNAGKLGNIPA